MCGAEPNANDDRLAFFTVHKVDDGRLELTFTGCVEGAEGGHEAGGLHAPKEPSGDSEGSTGNTIKAEGHQAEGGARVEPVRRAIVDVDVAPLGVEALTSELQVVQVVTNICQAP